MGPRKSRRRIEDRKATSWVSVTLGLSEKLSLYGSAASRPVSCFTRVTREISAMSVRFRVRRLALGVSLCSADQASGRPARPGQQPLLVREGRAHSIPPGGSAKASRNEPAGRPCRPWQSAAGGAVLHALGRVTAHACMHHETTRTPSRNRARSGYGFGALGRRRSFHALRARLSRRVGW